MLHTHPSLSSRPTPLGPTLPEDMITPGADALVYTEGTEGVVTVALAPANIAVSTHMHVCTAPWGAQAQGLAGCMAAESCLDTQQSWVHGCMPGRLLGCLGTWPICVNGCRVRTHSIWLQSLHPLVAARVVELGGRLQVLPLAAAVEADARFDLKQGRAGTAFARMCRQHLLNEGGEGRSKQVVLYWHRIGEGLTIPVSLQNTAGGHRAASSMLMQVCK
eukprot:1157652-Pelagomonas_calceolata.AAC.15